MSMVDEEMTMYQIYGDYGLSTQNLLEESHWLQVAREWLNRYVRWNDFGGYENIYIVDQNGRIYQAAYAGEF